MFSNSWVSTALTGIESSAFDPSWTYFLEDLPKSFYSAEGLPEASYFGLFSNSYFNYAMIAVSSEWSLFSTNGWISHSVLAFNI